MSFPRRFGASWPRLAAVAALVLLVASATYQVSEPQQAILTQFGRPVGSPIVTPGIHFKLPLIQRANYFDRRLLLYESRSTQIPTKDKRYISVAAFAHWRINDPLKFFQRVENEAGAQGRLDEIIEGEVRNVVARYDLIELVRSSARTDVAVTVQSEEESLIFTPLERGRQRLVSEILARARARTVDLGFEITDVRFTRMSYVADVQKAVFARMIAERQRIAQLYWSQGEGEAARIGGERERDLARIRSEAYRAAETRRGEADAEAARVYALAYGRDPDFYTFVKSLDTYERSFDPATIMILDSNSDFLKFLGRSR